MFNVPKKVSMGGQVIEVKISKYIDPEVVGSNPLGCLVYLQNTIYLATHFDGKPLAKSQVEQTFYHEYAHLILFHCRKNDLALDEDLVDLMGEFLYQSLGKAKWR